MQKYSQSHFLPFYTEGGRLYTLFYALIFSLSQRAFYISTKRICLLFLNGCLNSVVLLLWFDLFNLSLTTGWLSSFALCYQYSVENWASAVLMCKPSGKINRLEWTCWATVHTCVSFGIEISKLPSIDTCISDPYQPVWANLHSQCYRMLFQFFQHEGWEIFHEQGRMFSLCWGAVCVYVENLYQGLKICRESIVKRAITILCILMWIMMLMT